MSYDLNFSPQQPQQFNLASAGQCVGAPGYMETGQYAMPSYGGISQLGAVNAPPAQGNWFGRDGNMQTVFGGIQALGGAYLGIQAMKQAKDQLNFQKQAYKTNLVNSTKTYNTSLEDRINGRTADYAGKQADVSAYLSTHKL